jgi:hypothetical protein
MVIPQNVGLSDAAAAQFIPGREGANIEVLAASLEARGHQPVLFVSNPDAPANQAAPVPLLRLNRPTRRIVMVSEQDLSL